MVSPNTLSLVLRCVASFALHEVAGMPFLTTSMSSTDEVDLLGVLTCSTASMSQCPRMLFRLLAPPGGAITLLLLRSTSSPLKMFVLVILLFDL